MTPVPALLALWLAGQVASSGELAGLGGERLHLSADVARREGSASRISYEGHAVLRSESVLVRADALTYDEAAERVEARGHAMLVAGEFVAVADALALDIPAQQVTVTEGLVLQKRNVTVAALREARTPEELLQLGENALALRGARIQRLGPGHFRVQDVSLVPCDCDPKAPAWRIHANEAEVVAGEKATLRGWRVLVGDVPVLPPLPVPWAEVPLSERRSGLLFPDVTFSGPSGFGLAQPIYWAPHPSYDFTFTPGYFFGQGEAEDSVDPAAPPEARVPASPTGVRGPRLLTEFRYAPAPGLEGRALLGLVYDFRLLRNPLDRTPVQGERRGLRGNLSLEHAHELGHGLGLRANLGLVSDGFYLADQSADVLGRQEQYTRSTVVLSQRGDDHLVALDGVFRQDIRTGHHFFASNQALNRLAGVGNGPTALHRLPGFTLALPERHLAGPLFGGVHLSYARLAPFRGPGGDEGLDGVAALAVTDWGDAAGAGEGNLGEGNGRFDPGERERRNRLDLMPRLSAPLQLGDVLRLTPAVAWRQTAYLGEVTGHTATRGYPLLEAAAETQLARGFGGASSRWTHVLTPRVVGRWVPFVLGRGLDARLESYDAWDAPFSLVDGVGAQGEGLLQAAVELKQRLLVRGGGGTARDVLHLTVGQGLDLLRWTRREGPARLADAYARLDGRLGPVTAWARVRAEPSADWALHQLATGLSLDFGPTAGLSAELLDMARAGSDRMRRGMDALVGPGRGAPAGDPTLDRAQLVLLGARWAPPVRGLGLRAALRLEPHFRPATASEGGERAPLAAAEAGLTLSPAPDCWSLEARGGVQRYVDGVRATLQPTFGLSLTIANFGTFGI